MLFQVGGVAVAHLYGTSTQVAMAPQ